MAEVHTISITDEEIVFQVELMCWIYLNAQVKNCAALMEGSIDVFNGGLVERLEISLRNLLREPLRNPVFRKEFNQYFVSHASAAFRNVAVPWMDEVLVWEE